MILKKQNYFEALTCALYVSSREFSMSNNICRHAPLIKIFKKSQNYRSHQLSGNEKKIMGL